jgi:hypothetical protein
VADVSKSPILAKLGLKTGSLGALVTLPAREAARILLRHFADRIARSGRRERTLQIIHAMDMIKNLPAGISSIFRRIADELRRAHRACAATPGTDSAATVARFERSGSASRSTDWRARK